MNETRPAVEPVAQEHTRTGLGTGAIKRAFLDNLFYVQARSLEASTTVDHFQALVVVFQQILCDQVNAIN